MIWINKICWQFFTASWLFLGGILLSFWHVVMVLNSFLMILSGLLRGLDDFLTVYWECLMNNCGRSLLRAEWSRTAKKLTSWQFGILLVQIRIVGQGPNSMLYVDGARNNGAGVWPWQSPERVGGGGGKGLHSNGYMGVCRWIGSKISLLLQLDPFFFNLMVHEWVVFIWLV